MLFFKSKLTISQMVRQAFCRCCMEWVTIINTTHTSSKTPGLDACSRFSVQLASWTDNIVGWY